MYWVIMSAAALKALLQIVITPTLWEKTVHGLEKSRTTARIPAT
jgi:glycosyltransferase XagB